MFSVGFLQAQDLKSAIKLTDSEQFGAANTIYQNLIKQQPQNADIYFYLGESYLKSYFTDTANVDLKEVTQLAKAQFEKGVSVDPTNPLNFVGLGKAAIYSGDYNAAATEFAKGRCNDPFEKTKNRNHYCRKTGYYSSENC
jgi:tetratricopeptide (TPR) repeat protein